MCARAYVRRRPSSAEGCEIPGVVSVYISLFSLPVTRRCVNALNSLRRCDGRHERIHLCAVDPSGCWGPGSSPVSRMRRGERGGVGSPSRAATSPGIPRRSRSRRSRVPTHDVPPPTPAPHAFGTDCRSGRRRIVPALASGEGQALERHLSPARRSELRAHEARSLLRRRRGRGSRRTARARSADCSLFGAQRDRRAGCAPRARAGIAAVRIAMINARPATVSDREEWRHRLVGNAQPLRERLPGPPAREDPERNSDHDRDQRGDRGLPRDRGRHLPTPEPEHLEDRKVAPAPARRREECVRQRPDRHDAEERGDDRRQPADTAQIDEVGRLRGKVGIAEMRGERAGSRGRHRRDPGRTRTSMTSAQRVGYKPASAFERHRRARRPTGSRRRPRVARRVPRSAAAPIDCPARRAWCRRRRDPGLRACACRA